MTYRLIAPCSRELVVLIHAQRTTLVDYLLHRVLDELVETLQLLSNQTFVTEERVDHRPIILRTDRLLVRFSIAAVSADGAIVCSASLLLLRSICVERLLFVRARGSRVV